VNDEEWELKLSAVSPCSSCSRNSLTISCATRSCETAAVAAALSKLLLLAGLLLTWDIPSKRPAMDSAHCQSPNHHMEHTHHINSPYEITEQQDFFSYQFSLPIPPNTNRLASCNRHRFISSLSIGKENLNKATSSPPQQQLQFIVHHIQSCYELHSIFTGVLG